MHISNPIYGQFQRGIIQPRSQALSLMPTYYRWEKATGCGWSRYHLDRFSFALVEMNKNYSLILPRWKSLCHRWSHDQSRPGSFSQEQLWAEEPGNAVGDHLLWTRY